MDQLPGDDGFSVDSGFRAFSAIFTVGIVIMALFGIGFVVAGVVLVVRARRRAAQAATWAVRGRTTTGTVVDNRIESHPDRRLVFAPVVRFEADGREVTVVGDQRWNRSFVTGLPARVVYDPATPDRAVVRAQGGSVFGSVGSGILLAVFGVLFLTVLSVIARGFASM
ncbi:MAG: DUF3592 domain-containing protein [Janthinobacterium lividum]